MRFETAGFEFISMNQLVAPCFDYLPESGGSNLAPARSLATPRLFDQVPTLPGIETPVCCELIGELINEDQIILGGEESTGLSIKGHNPKKDGILAPWFAAEAVAAGKAAEAVGRRIRNSHYYGMKISKVLGGAA